jgi:transposase
VVELGAAEKAELVTMIRRGKESARRLARARILLKATAGWVDEAIAEAVDVSTGTVERTRKRYVREGLQGALREHPRPGKQRKLNGKQEAHLIAVACSAAPKGHAGWSLRLLANKVVELGYSDSISAETVRQVLKKTN